MQHWCRPAMCPTKQRLFRRVWRARIGHAIRIPSNRLHRRILYGKLLAARRHPGSQKKRFSDNMKQKLKCCHIPSEPLDALASNRQIWRDTYNSGLATFLAEYESAAENRRVRRHQPATVTFSVFRWPDATGLVRRLSACTAIVVPKVNDYNICSGASSSTIDWLPQASKAGSGVVGKVHLVSWTSVVGGNWVGVVFCCIVFRCVFFPVFFVLSAFLLYEHPNK